MRDNARGRVPDAEQPSLALGHDLETHRRLVERGMPLLELPQCRPFRFAHGLARRFDRQLVAHRRPPAFFRRTLRGGCCERAGAGFGDSGLFAAPLPPPSPPPPPSSRGGVRELFFSNSDGAGVFGISPLVISPCPTVQRFVVTQ